MTDLDPTREMPGGIRADIRAAVTKLAGAERLDTGRIRGMSAPIVDKVAAVALHAADAVESRAAVDEDMTALHRYALQGAIVACGAPVPGDLAGELALACDLDSEDVAALLDAARARTARPAVP